MSSDNFHIFAPAKINLFLHITGRREDGYHTLQSLMAFADVGDDLAFSAQDGFSVDVRGPFATALPEQKDNLIYKAARLLSEEYKVPMRGKIILTKNLPIASGIGGGSADAAAALKGLVRLWELPNDSERLEKIALQLGADVPACLHGKTVWAEGIGEKLTSLPDIPAVHLVLVNPLVATATPAVFRNFRGGFSPSINARHMTIDNLKQCRNDLTEAALAVTPVIDDVLRAIANTEHCRFERLSGSGATCFGVYENEAAAQNAAAILKTRYPAWWIISTNVR
jgi:4-diphosphocytidyl-2-C-methyl-D-erythritol kinase